MGRKNHVNHSKNQRILNIFKPRTIGYWRGGVQGADCPPSKKTNNKFLKLFLDSIQRGRLFTPK